MDILGKVIVRVSVKLFIRNRLFSLSSSFDSWSEFSVRLGATSHVMSIGALKGDGVEGTGGYNQTA